MKQLPDLEVLGIDLMVMPDPNARALGFLEFKRLNEVHIFGHQPYNVQAITAAGVTALSDDSQTTLSKLRAQHPRMVLVDGYSLRDSLDADLWPDSSYSAEEWFRPRYGLGPGF